MENHALEVGVSLVAASGLTGFRVIESLKAKAKKEDKEGCAIKNSWWAIPYMFTFPGGLLAISYTVHMSNVHRIYAWILAIMMMPCLSVLKIPPSWESPAAFGVRGCVLAFLATASIRTVLAQPSIYSTQGLHYLSLLSFAMAAWYTCALGSFGAWTAHPELGQYAEVKRNLLSTVQMYFVLGFLFSYLAHNSASLHDPRYSY
mmetsp:Transcript_9108/g.12645  ORF Transcript_9108/g.12645 Transcript_9108/m.12645 type:complete len:203 (-) Transcript_9108:95-703(-)|eukprot:CAMPEP_0185739076 /NCGR_PEP_ID=MMETSP1171-20130828/34549_1 /TAXON_ID=374046 /ORGANISM="Helicotheca tamensis, Strain CCMP826" /LENGTH=202 /DNA_ID=CAMNT_0028410517 /DNA_START=40 /DNA_END=648 /DNA_ORIENTATION=+